MKILLVEDNDLNRDMLSRRLIKRGFEVLSAVNGKEGIDKAVTDNPDLILMDLSLPKMDGWTATKTIKSNEHLNSIPIIALSAHAMDEHKQRALEAGCNDYDTKPVDIDRLLSKINDQLKK